MEPFKNLYQKKSVTEIADAIGSAYSEFKRDQFIKDATQGINKLELKDRVKLISKALTEHLTPNYERNIKIILKATEDQLSGFLVWPLTTYIENNGIEHFETSFHAMEHLTQVFTAEFCIRPFIEHNDKKAFKILHSWKKHKNHHVRRLVSEGSRPHLPWGIKVAKINENLARNIKLIKGLENDESLYVRKSVANHLNDISKLDTELFFDTIESFKENENSDWVKRHASRTLLKKAHPRALELHGYKPIPKSIDLNFKVLKDKITEGDNLPIELQIKLPKAQNLLIEYIIHYKKSNGAYSEKVFRLRDIKNKSKVDLLKNISFKKVTTRVHYEGEHYIEIQVNGKRFAKKKFYLSL